MDSPWATTTNINYWSGLQSVAILKAKISGGSQVCTFGDSTTQIQPWESIGGLPYQNCGMAWSGIIDVSNWIIPIVPLLKPSVSLVLIGINDTGRSSPPDYVAWKNSYEGFIGGLMNYSTVKLFTILPIEAGYGAGEVARTPEIQELNTQIKAVGSAFGLTVIDSYAALAQLSGYALPGVTQDGIHPSALGYSILKPLYDAAVL
jgi:acyl-CoA thioesterase I